MINSVSTLASFGISNRGAKAFWFACSAGFALLIATVSRAASEPSVLPQDTYRISPRDLLEIRLYDEPDLSVLQRVDDDGFLKLPLIEKFSATEHTLSSLEAAIEAAYQSERILRNPDVTVFIREYAIREVSVLGQVRRPGTLRFPAERNSLSIVEVISLSGGFTDIAKGTSVRITRRSKDGLEMNFEVDANELISGDRNLGKGTGFTVLPGDILFVPERVF